MEDWKWEECDIPVCEENCARPGLGQEMGLPSCEEYVEENPELQAAVSLFSGGGVGVGDSLEYLNDDLVKSTCRADGKLLDIGNPLMVSPLQLKRMATMCHPSHPHSCAGEIWSGFSVINQMYFGVILVAENTVTESASLHMLGLNSFSACDLVYTRDLAQSYLLGNCGQQELSLPYQENNQFMVAYTSSVIKVMDGRLKIVMLGEREKICVVSPARIGDLKVEEDNITLVLFGSEGESVSISLMSWEEDFETSHVVDFECIIGSSENEHRMFVHFVDDGGSINLESECRTF